jgi:hypothetical protein
MMLFQPAPNSILSHWYHLIEGFQASTQAFYTAIEQGVQARQIPKTKMSRINWRETRLFSAKREYLRVHRHDLVFDICAAPFGTGFFVSWWLGELESGWRAILAKIPLIGGLLARVAHRPFTYYTLDTAFMFQESVHNAVLEVLDAHLSSNGLRALPEAERKPVMKDFFKK